MSVALDTTEHGAGSPLKIKVSRVVRNPKQPRTYFDEDGLELLANAIQAEGQQHAVEVCRLPHQPGEFILIDGERRWRAHHIIWKRTGVEPTIDCIFKAVKDAAELYKLSAMANLQREDLCELDEAATYYQLRQDGETLENIARMRGKSVTHVEDYLRVHELPDEVKALMHPKLPKNERLSVTQAIGIARSIPKNAPELRISVAQEAVERNLSVAETRSLIEHRTGNRVHRPSGRLRKPSDDYKVFQNFLWRTRAKAKYILDELDVDELYLHREDDEGDRRKDLVQINAIIAQMERLRDTITH